MRATNRIHGYDVARALAIFGMVAAHLTPGQFPGEWLIHWYPSALFAVLVGVSTALLLSRQPQLSTRYGFLVRAAFILLLGVALDEWPTMISVVLITIALEMFILTLIHHWSTRVLCIILIALVLFGPLVNLVLYNSVFGVGLLGGSYPLLVWVAYGIGGVVLHRLLQFRPAAAWAVLPVGVLAVGLAYPLRGLGEFPGKDVGWIGFPATGGVTPPIYYSDYLGAMPHSGGLVDVVTTLLGAAGVIALCVLACRLPLLVMLSYPLRAVGSMPLTIYTYHVLSEPILTWLFGNSIRSDETFIEQGYEPDMPWPTYQDKVARSEDYEAFWEQEELWWQQQPLPEPEDYIDVLPTHTGEFWVTVLVAVVFASLWRIWLRRGPLEWVVAATVRWAVVSAQGSRELDDESVAAGRGGR